MNLNNSKEARRIVPRWRSFRAAATTIELVPVAKASTKERFDVGQLDRARSIWEIEQSIASASDYLTTAYILGNIDEAQRPANFLIRNEGVVKQPLLNLAREVSTGEQFLAGSTPNNINSELGSIHEAVVLQICFCKNCVRLWPKVATFWVDLSRLYAILGEDKKATHAMEVALHLEPDSRFVLRAAARFFIHLHEPDRALVALRRNPSNRSDPWILAADIATSTIIGPTSPFANAGRNIIKRTHSDFTTSSELASALGTIELRDGANKRAKKLFDHSLRRPTENAVAQAIWASRKLTGIDASSGLTIPNSYEANARYHAMKGNWTASLDSTYDWAVDEPFSSGPAIAGSFVAESILQDHRRAVDFCLYGLRSNRSDFMLINNLTVALVGLGEIDRAREFLNRLPRKTKATEESITRAATEGLLLYREGHIEAARESYSVAVELSERARRIDLKAVALAYAAREELANYGERSKEYAARARECARRTNDFVIDSVLDSVLGRVNN